MKNLKITVAKDYRKYLGVLRGISRITNKELDLLDALHALSIETITPKNKKLIVNAIKVSKSTLNLMINTLYKKKVLIKKSHGVYTIHSLLKEITNLNIVFDEGKCRKESM